MQLPLELLNSVFDSFRLKYGLLQFGKQVGLDLIGTLLQGVRASATLEVYRATISATPFLGTPGYDGEIVAADATFQEAGQQVWTRRSSVSESRTALVVVLLTDDRKAACTRFQSTLSMMRSSGASKGFAYSHRLTKQCIDCILKFRAEATIDWRSDCRSTRHRRSRGLKSASSRTPSIMKWARRSFTDLRCNFCAYHLIYCDGNSLFLCAFRNNPPDLRDSLRFRYCRQVIKAVENSGRNRLLLSGLAAAEHPDRDGHLCQCLRRQRCGFFKKRLLRLRQLEIQHRAAVPHSN